MLILFVIIYSVLLPNKKKRISIHREVSKSKNRKTRKAAKRFPLHRWDLGEAALSCKTGHFAHE